MQRLKPRADRLCRRLLQNGNQNLQELAEIGRDAVQIEILRDVLVRSVEDAELPDIADRDRAIQMWRRRIGSTVQRDQLCRELRKSTLQVRVLGFDDQQLLLRLQVIVEGAAKL